MRYEGPLFFFTLVLNSNRSHMATSSLINLNDLIKQPKIKLKVLNFKCFVLIIKDKFCSLINFQFSKLLARVDIYKGLIEDLFLPYSISQKFYKEIFMNVYILMIWGNVTTFI